MATSGRIEGSYPGGSWVHYVPYIKWSVTQSAADNKSTMSVTFGMRKTGANSQSYNLEPQTLAVKVNGTTYTRSITFDHRSSSYPADYDKVTIGGIVIPHNRDGTKSVAISASHPTDTAMGTGAVSGTAVLTAIPRASTLTVPAMTMGKAATITVNRASSSFTHTITYSFGGKTGTIATKTSNTSVSWTPPTSLASQIPNATGGTLTLTCQTYSGSTLIGTTTAAVTLSVPAYTPAATLAVETVNDNATVASWGVALKGYSRLKCTVSGSTQYGASISGCEVQANGETLTGSPATTDLLKTTDGAVRARVQDSRGKWSAWTETSVKVWDYGPPSISSCAVFRSTGSGVASDTGKYYRVECVASGAPVGGERNTLTVSARRRDSGGDWGSPYRILRRKLAAEQSTVSATATLGGSLSESQSYEIEVSVSDSLGNSRQLVFLIPTAEVTLHLKDGGHAAAFGKYAQKDRTLEVAWDLDVDRTILQNGVPVAVESGQSFTGNAWWWQISQAGHYAVKDNYGNDVVPQNRGFVSASLILSTPEGVPLQYIRANGTEDAYAPAFSPVLYVNLPFPVVGASLSGAPDQGYGYLTGVNFEQGVGVYFRLGFPAATKTQRENKLVSVENIKLSLQGPIRNIPANPPAGWYDAAAAQEVVGIAQSYVDAVNDGRARFWYNENWLYNGTGHPLFVSKAEVDANGKAVKDENGNLKYRWHAAAECDTFVGLVLRGLDYDHSPYARLMPTATPTADSAPVTFDYGDLEGYITDVYGSTVEDRTGWPSWLKWVFTTLRQNRYWNRDLKFAPDLAWMMWYKSAVFSDAEQTLPGDVVFWTKPGGSSFDQISHVGLIDVVDGERYVFEMTGGGTSGWKFLHKVKLADRDGNQPAYFARIKFIG